MEQDTSDEIHPKPRALWKGTLAFDLVSIPVELHRAVTPKHVRFSDLHDEDNGRIQRRPVCARDGEPVPYEHVVKGYELERGRFVQILPRELDALAPEATKTIEIDTFVDPAEVDPIFFDARYYLVPGAGATRAYAVLLAAMTAQNKAAIARTIMRDKQRLCVIQPAGTPGHPGGALTLTILDYADEIVPLSTFEALPGPDTALDEGDQRLAERLLSLRSARFEPERYHDEHRERVLAFIHAKAQGLAPEGPTEPPPARILDLRAALEASLAEEEHRLAA